MSMAMYKLARNEKVHNKVLGWKMEDINKVYFKKENLTNNRSCTYAHALYFKLNIFNSQYCHTC